MKIDPSLLLEAALEVFARDGLQSASLRAIAKQAGCDPSLIYYHFEHKEAMFRALLEERIPPLVADLRRLAEPGDGRGTAEKLWAALGILHARLGASAGFRALVRGELVRGAAGVRALLAERLAQAQLAIRTLFEEGVRRGDLRADLDPGLTPFFLVRMEFEILDLVPGAPPGMAGLPPAQALARAERTWFGLFWRGVAARPEEPLPGLAPFPEP